MWCGREHPPTVACRRTEIFPGRGDLPVDRRQPAAPPAEATEAFAATTPAPETAAVAPSPPLAADSGAAEHLLRQVSDMLADDRSRLLELFAEERRRLVAAVDERLATLGPNTGPGDEEGEQSRLAAEVARLTDVLRRVLEENEALRSRVADGAPVERSSSDEAASLLRIDAPDDVRTPAQPARRRQR